MKKTYIGLLIFAVFFVAGCSHNKDTAEGPFIGGVNGVSISFVEGAPLTEFSQSRQVPVKVLLKNNGEYDIATDKAEVQLFGLPLSEYGLSTDFKKVAGELRGIKKGLLEEGGEQLVDMGTLAYSRAVSGSLDATLHSRVCYPYQTQTRVTVCGISRDIQTVEKDNICDVLDTKLITGGVSSGPIQLASIEEQLTGSDKVSFRITVQNSGAGEVYDMGSTCSQVVSDPVISSQNKGKIKFTIMPSDITCSFLEGESNTGYVKLDGASKTLVCTMKVEGSSSYKREIEIFLDYKYIESSSIDLKILEA